MINNSPSYTEPLGGDSDPPGPHFPVDPHWQCPGRAAPVCSPCLLPLEGKYCFSGEMEHGAHELRDP